MKYSFNWLKELSGTEKTPEQVAELLTMKSMEVEGVEKSVKIPEGVIVGKILEIGKHPNADKLQIVKVDTGGSDLLSVVCGAWNIKVGDMVPVATVGTKLPGGIEIAEAEIRGEKSFGMLCAEDELGLGENHEGIFILSKKAKIGETVSKHIGSQDTLIEIKVLPDRAHDCLSHVGVAREICALEGREFDYDFEGLKLPKIKKTRSEKETRNVASLQARIKDKKLCRRYICALMGGMEIKPSPRWMRERLKSCGIKSINNVVDATNYIMLELGQPLHAFDFEKIKTVSGKENKEEAEIVVRRAEAGEEMVLLDDTRIKLDDNDLLIAGKEKPLALAGIKGGKESGISEKTERVVLEAASFDPISIRKTRSRLGLRTDSSDRFEKELDPNLAEKALVRLIEILEKTAGGRLEKIVDTYPAPAKPWKIKLDMEYAELLLGGKIPDSKAVKILKSLGFEARKISGGKNRQWEVAVPTFRVDAKTREDLVEEIGRIWGYEKIAPCPVVSGVVLPRKNEDNFLERKAQDVLCGLGYDEMYNYSFYSSEEAEISGKPEEKHFEVANPMNPDQRFVRTGLLPNFLKNVRKNSKNFESFRIFEIGKTYLKGKSGRPEEKRMLVFGEVLAKDSGEETFLSVKGAGGDFLENLGFENERVSFGEISSEKPWHPFRTAEVKIDQDAVGKVGEIDPQILEKAKIKKRTAVFELDLEKLRDKFFKNKKNYLSIPRFPGIRRDISLIAPFGVRAGDIAEKIKTSGGGLVSGVEMFDIFKKDGRMTSYAFHIDFLDREKTLESGEADVLFEKISSALELDLGAEVRK